MNYVLMFKEVHFVLRLIHNAWWRVCLKLGVDATVRVTTANHITFLVLHERDWLVSALGYLHKVIWLADACIVAWKVEMFSTSAASNASEATRQTHNSVQQCLTSRH